MKKLIIILLSFIPVFGIAQARVLNGQYNDNSTFGKPIKDTVRTLRVTPPLSVVSGGASYVDTLTAVTTLTTLTDGATIIWDYNTQTTEAKITIAGNRTLSITNLPSGKVVYLTLGVTQDATGGRTLALPSGTKVINGGAGSAALTTAASATDILSFRWDGTTLFCTYGKNYN